MEVTAAETPPMVTTAAVMPAMSFTDIALPAMVNAVLARVLPLEAAVADADAADAAVTAGAERLLIGHFSSRYKSPEVLLAEAKEIFPNTEIAEEGETYTV